METRQPLSRTIRWVVGISILIILFPVIYGLVSYLPAMRTSELEPFLEPPSDRTEGCVRETTYMRYHHMDLLREVREQVVRDGVRGEITLSRCRECHSNRDQFCNRCHQAVSLNLDCFGCHYYPEQPEELRAGR